MAVIISAYTVVIRVDSVEERFPGGMAALEAFCPNRTFCSDDHIARAAFMASIDAERFAMALVEHGLRSRRDGESDLAIVVENGRPLPELTWLAIGRVEGHAAAWRLGQEPGALIGAWMADDSLTPISPEELRTTYEHVDSKPGLHTYRHRMTGQLIYIGRVGSQDGAPAQIPRWRAYVHRRLATWSQSLVGDETVLERGLPLPGRLARMRLKAALQLISHALSLSEYDARSLFLAGRIHRRLEEPAKALGWFQRGSNIQPYEPSFLREASMCALQMGNSVLAVQIARRATELSPNDRGLRSNLAVALLISNRLDDARTEVDRVLAVAPKDSLAQTIGMVIDHFAASGGRPPATLGALEGVLQSRAAFFQRVRT